MADSIDELVPVLRDLVPLARNRIATLGVDTEIGDAGTGRSRAEWAATLASGATKATKFGLTWHAVKAKGEPPDAEGLAASCAIDLWLVGTRSAKTGRPTSIDWASTNYAVIGQAYEELGLTWGGRFKNRVDGPHGQGPRLAHPDHKHWAMSISDLDDFCRDEINQTRALRGMPPLGRSAWV